MADITTARKGRHIRARFGILTAHADGVYAFTDMWGSLVTPVKIWRAGTMPRSG